MILRYVAIVVFVWCLGALTGSGALAAGVNLTIEAIEADAERDAPSICISFSSPLERQAKTNFDEYLRLEPKVDLTYEVNGRKLCLLGAVHGRSYSLTIKRGLPARLGAVLAQDRTVNLQFDDRKPSVAFRPGGYVLPQSGPRQLVVRTVNVREVRVRVMRIPDRGLAAVLGARGGLTSLSAAEVEDLANRAGEEVFRGQLSIIEAPNRAVETGLSLDEALANAGPGLFVAIADRKGPKTPNAKNAAQWFVISDLGLVSIVNKDALHVAVRSLSSGRPIAGANLNLMARNNRELGRAVTGPDGMARFEAANLKGAGGNAPFAVFANNGETDFSYLALDAPSLNLGAEPGRAIGSPKIGTDAYSGYLALSAGHIKPGQKLQAIVLARDDQGKTPTGIPVLISLLRPDGAEAQRVTIPDLANGAGRVSFQLPPNAAPGPWRMVGTIGAKRLALAEAGFQVIDPRPVRVVTELIAPDEITLGRDTDFTIAARYADGSPAQGLSVQADITIAPFDLFKPGLDGFVFGRPSEASETRRIDLGTRVLDAKGTLRAGLKLSAQDLPLSARALEGILRVAVIDPNGQAIERRARLVINGTNPIIGLKPLFGDEMVAEGTPASIEVVSVDGNGRLLDRAPIGYEILAEETDYHWLERDGAWTWREVTRDRRVGLGTIALKANGPSIITTPQLAQGRYRLVVFDPKTIVEASLKFRAGTWSVPVTGQAPDHIALSIDPAPRKPGDNVRIGIRPPYDAQVSVMLADRDIREVRNMPISAEGGEVSIKLPDDLRGDLQVLVSAFGDPSRLKGAQAARALGLGHIFVDDPARRLAVSFAAPTFVNATRRTSIPVILANLAEGETAMIYARAVPIDPDMPVPEAWQPTRQWLKGDHAPVQVADTYDRLIDSRGVTRGQLRSWTDPSQGDSVAVADAPLADVKKSAAVERVMLPTPTSSSPPAPLAIPNFAPAQFSGPLSGANGTVDLSFDLEGAAKSWRVEVIAIAGDRLGDATTQVTSPAPYHLDLALPSALAPGDEFVPNLTIGLGQAAPGPATISLTAQGERTDPSQQTLSTVLSQESKQRPLLAKSIKAGPPGSKVQVGLGMAEASATSDAMPASIMIPVRQPGLPLVKREITTIAPKRTAITPASITATSLAASTSAGNMASHDLALFGAAAFDWSGLLRSLGAAEPLDAADRAAVIAPVLVGNDLNRVPGYDRAERDRARIDDIIASLAESQNADGSFGPPGRPDEGDDMLSALCIDVLARARDRNYRVPPSTLERGIKRLALQATSTDRAIGARAYALYVLARMRAIELTEAQSFADSSLQRLSGPLARAHVAGALMVLGDRDRARRIFAGTILNERTIIAKVEPDLSLRDIAGALAVGVEHRILRADEWQPMADMVAARAEKNSQYSAEEKINLILAAPALLHRGGTVLVAIDGKAETEADQPLFRSFQLNDAAPSRPKLDVENRAKVRVQRLDTITYWPGQRPAFSSGISLKKTLLHMDGKPADLSRLRKAELVIVILEGVVETGAKGTLVASDPLPAGLVIEGTALGMPISPALAGIGPLTRASILPLTDRFEARLGPEDRPRTIRLAYLARASFAGRYLMPGASLFDSAQPDRGARTGDGHVVIIGD